jgi:hypothetical protein
MTDNYELQELRREVSELKELVMAQAKATEGLVDAWKTAQGMVRLVKIVGYIATAATGVWALFHVGKS